MIKRIIEDFENKIISPFFDLDVYQTDFEKIKRISPYLRIGYISKEKTDHPEYAIYINFTCRAFSISGFLEGHFLEKTFFKDKYKHYKNVEEVYNTIKQMLLENENIRRSNFFKNINIPLVDEFE